MSSHNGTGFALTSEIQGKARAPRFMNCFLKRSTPKPQLYQHPSLHAVAPVAPKRGRRTSTRSGNASMAVVPNPSNAIPFLIAPACQSSNMAGAETGFDPLYLGDLYRDLKWLREAELKHGRICMLAATGILVQELVGLPGYPGYTPNPVEACQSVPGYAFAQILIACGAIEIGSNFKRAGTGRWSEVFIDNPSLKPGDIGFDPLGLAKNASPEKLKRYELAELKNGRLAMLAFSGMLHQVFVTGKPVLASLGDVFASD